MLTIYINYVDVTEPIAQLHPGCRPSRHSYLLKRDYPTLSEAHAFLDRVKQRADANPDIVVVDYSIYSERKLVEMRGLAYEARYH